MPQVSEALYNFLQARKTLANADLVDRWSTAMETQVNVIAGDGEPVAGKKSTWSNGSDTWHSIRIPKNAATDPTWEDYKIGYPFDLYAEGIGMTGFDWKARLSRHFGYDFDALTGHAQGIGIEEKELEKVKQAACALPYVEVRRSTGGGGIHLYVYLDEAGVPTANHTEHAALARCILGMMSAEVGFDFASAIDACGHVMWVWHRKMSAENHGLEIIKPATTRLSAADLPANWRDHIEVVKGQRAKVRVNGVPEGEYDAFDTLASARPQVPLDAQHKAQVEALMRSRFTTLWVPDYHLLQTHTKALKALMDDPHENRDLTLIGIFQTVSEGHDPGTPNCFLFPLKDGGWRVFRFGMGVKEAPTWCQDGEGWTWTYYNVRPDLRTAARAYGGAEGTEGLGFVFDRAADAIKAAEAMGEQLDLPEKYHERAGSLKRSKLGRLVVRVKREEGDAKPGQGWVSQRGGWWERVTDTRTDIQPGENHTGADAIIRVLVSPTRESIGYALKSEYATWDYQTQSNSKMYLQSLGFSKSEAEAVMGTAVGKRWVQVCLPFREEYPGGRQWNLDAPQYVYAPADTDDPHHPTWDALFMNWGRSLDKAVRENQWCKANGIKTGAQYLLLCYATMLRWPERKLPILFFWGEGDSGKSTYIEAFQLLVTGNWADAKRALGDGQFNGELQNCVLAYVDEHDLSKDAKAASKIKEWSTALNLSIRKMRTNQYTVPSYLHFVQCANDPTHCRIYPADCRIVVVCVTKPAVPIKKEALHTLLLEEAPHFMRTILDLTLPPPDGRMAVAVLSTAEKRHLSYDGEHVAQFVDEVCAYDPAARIAKQELHERYLLWCLETDVSEAERLKITAFGRKLLAIGGGKVTVGDKVTTDDGTRKDAYTGIKIKREEATP
jgi:hypothetical protein